jgi:hypothetical protein
MAESVSSEPRDFVSTVSSSSNFTSPYLHEMATLDNGTIIFVLTMMSRNRLANADGTGGQKWLLLARRESNLQHVRLSRSRCS